MNRDFIAGFAAALLMGWVVAAAPAPTPTPEPDPLPQFPRLERTNLWNVQDWHQQLAWEPFRTGVDIHRLYGDGTSGPTAALLRFRTAAKVPARQELELQLLG